MTTYSQDPDRQNFVCYDTANSIIGADADHSQEVVHPEAIQVEALAVGTTVDIQVRCSRSASWVTVATKTNADTPAIHHFGASRYGFVQLVRTGSGAVVAYAQK